MEEWASLHLYYHDVEGLDRVLLEVVRPAVQSLKAERCLAQYFFVRYWTGGPHIRLRLRGEAPNWQEVVTDHVRNRFAAFTEQMPSQANLDPVTFYQKFGRLGEDDQNPFLYADNSIELIPYNRREELYGGPRAMPVNEELFHASSDTILAILPSLTAAPKKRLSVALELMLISAMQFQVPKSLLSLYFTRYSQIIREIRHLPASVIDPADHILTSQGDQLGQRLGTLLQTSVDQLPGPYRFWSNAARTGSAGFAELEAQGLLEKPRFELDSTLADEDPIPGAIPDIGVLHVHMLINRLGVPIMAETMLAHLLGRVLEERM